MKTLAELALSTQVSASGGDQQVKIGNICYDSRQAGPGSLFVAISGFRSDGHRFIGNAIDRGAVAVVVEKKDTVPQGVPWLEVPNTRQALGDLAAEFYHHPGRALRMIGVTGTNGKTTTTHLISAILEAAGRPVGLIGTLGNRLGDLWLDTAHTTPEASDLQQLLEQMRRASLKACVMEVSSHALQLERVRGLGFDAAVFTNLTQDHLDFHGDLSSYRSAKTRLFGLLDRNRTGNQYAVLNRDDPASEAMARSARAQLVYYGVKERADVNAADIRLSPEGLCFRVNWPEGSTELKLNLTGMFNVYNTLAAWAVGWQEGISAETMAGALAGVPGVPGRFEKVDEGQPYSVIVDYAHTPDGLENVLRAARALTKGRLILVFGCGGDRDRGKRPKMGAIAGELSDLAVITSDNPRSEDPRAIIDDIMEGFLGVRTDRYLVMPDRRKAIGLALAEAQPSDVIVVAGKGHETYQIVGDQVLPFDDRQIVREFLRAMEKP